MTPPVFLCPLDRVAPGGVLELAGAEGRHAARVRRLQPGEPADLVDGAGTRATALVTGVTGAGVTLEVGDVTHEPPPEPVVVVAQAIPKGERAELAVEMLTEVGVDVVVPWQAERCVAQWRGDRGVRALERWRSTAREAGKQSRRSRFPVVREPASTADVATLLAGAALPVVLSEDATHPLGVAAVPAAGQVVVVVGPEGGISPAEIAAFTAAGAVAYRLGPSVLRTSTAGVVAAGILLARSGRWAPNRL